MAKRALGWAFHAVDELWLIPDDVSRSNSLTHLLLLGACTNSSPCLYTDVSYHPAGSIITNFRRVLYEAG